MSDVKPDTSLYSDLPSRFRALAMISEAYARGETIQCRSASPLGDWNDIAAPCWLHDCQYRLKPKPRELWAVYTESGDWLYSFPTEDAAKNHAKGVPFVGKRKIVRFVEQPDTEA